MSKEITIAFPSLFGDLVSPWEEEYEIALSAGFNVCKFDEETKKIKKDLTDQLVVYRGWFVSEDDYYKFVKSVRERSGEVYTILPNYNAANSFQSWYKVLEKFTMPSHFVRETEFDRLVSYFNGNNGYFVKDNLKSLGSGEKSIAYSVQKTIDIYREIKGNRDFDIRDNGVCLRKIVDIQNEERFFVLDGHILGRFENIPAQREELVKKIAYQVNQKMNLSFISVDIALVDGKETLVEIGDFQVSDMNKDGEDIDRVKRIYKDLRLKILG